MAEISKTQICSVCGAEKELNLFYFRKDKNEYRKNCISCCSLSAKKYRQKMGDNLKEKKKDWWANNKHRFADINREKSRQYRKNNLEKVRLSAKNWAKRNRKKQVDYINNRYKTDPQFNLSIKIRRRIHMMLRRIKAGRKDRVINLLGCTYEFFKTYIESKFTEGMSWEQVFNGNIHLDHIKPCAKFNLFELEEQKKCFHYTNIQPLWAIDNIIKKDKYLEDA